ncbi:hypothetical protein JCM5353_006218 [Sporobolomyces roseus]
MQRSLQSISNPLKRIALSSTSSSRFLSTPSSTPSDPSTSPPSHYLITLLRSPLHLSPSIKSSLSSLGLYKRLSSTIVPISQTNQGYILRAKELLGVKMITKEQVEEAGRREWREREGEGRKGSGLRVREGQGENGVIRVGSERARGEERGFKVL